GGRADTRRARPQRAPPHVGGRSGLDFGRRLGRHAHGHARDASGARGRRHRGQPQPEGRAPARPARPVPHLRRTRRAGRARIGPAVGHELRRWSAHAARRGRTVRPSLRGRRRSGACLAGRGTRAVRGDQMKVVLFCGGLGTRLREFTGEIPKPMVKIGYRPILWHLMKYYAHYGHKDFILCLGYRADVIKQFFLNYEEWISNDFTLSKGGKELTLENNDIEDWKITFVDTGLHANIGERLVAVRRYVEDEDVFLANYSDGLTDLDLPTMIETFEA